MESRKPLEFHGTAGGYIVIVFLTLIMAYIPILGWAFMINYTVNWVTKNGLVNGKPVVFRSTYIDTLKFVVINVLLLVVTLGIYTFWFVPRLYRYIADHIEYVDAPTTSLGNTALPATQPPVDPTAPQPPVPTVPTTPTAG